MGADWIALLASFAYVFAMISIAEGLRKWRGHFIRPNAIGIWYVTSAMISRLDISPHC